MPERSLLDLDALQCDVEHLPDANAGDFIGWYELGEHRRQKVLALIREARAVREIRELMADFCLECDCETHTYTGEELLVVDEDGKPVECGGGYFAWRGARITAENQPADWPAGHVATPCGKCWACRLSALGCGLLHVIDGQGSRDISLSEVEEKEEIAGTPT